MHDPPRVSVAAASQFGSDAIERLRTVFEQSRHSMLIADDHRRWVAGNRSAADLLQIPREEIPWHHVDEWFTPMAGEDAELRWRELLSSGSAEGWARLATAERVIESIEFSAIAHVLPSRHLVIFMTPDGVLREGGATVPEAPWMASAGIRAVRHAELTDREREVMALVAAGFQTAELAERLFLSPETVKSHVQNALAKLGAHTRAHAVAIALMTGQITWEA